MAGLSAEGAVRAATTCLTVNGGFDVVLRMPGMAVSGSDAEQLGLGSPQFADVPMGPATWRGAGASRRLLVAANAVTAVVGLASVGAAESVFAAAVGVVVSDVLYTIVGCEAVVAGGEAVAYVLKVEAPAWA